jgi:7,8-dihydroneopterin aldolase/epimerase/oxygenase
LNTSKTMTIYLSNLSFYCYHGLYEEEKMVGGNYIVDVEMSIAPPAKTIQSIDETVNYVAAYEQVKNRMMQPTPLLETIVMELCNQLLDLSPLVISVSVSIKKLALPIEGFQGHTAVKWTKGK